MWRTFNANVPQSSFRATLRMAINSFLPGKFFKVAEHRQWLLTTGHNSIYSLRSEVTGFTTADLSER